MLLDAFRDACILVIDDTDFSREIVGHILKGSGIKNIRFAKDGVEGLDITLEYHPDLVIADLIMPNMDGYQYCREVRALKEYEDMPILVQTGIAEPERRAEAFTAGASDLLLKPVNAEELVARVLMHLDKRILMKKLREYNARIEAELDSARQMQQSLLPNDHMVAQVQQALPVRMASHFAASSELSGDFWGAVALSKHELAFYLVDFTGHGIMAALNTFRLHALINSDLRPTNNPGEYLTQLNKKLYELLIEQHFATMFYGVINFEKNKLYYAAAASPSPIMFSKDKIHGVKFIDGSGLPLGVLSKAEYKTLEVPFNSGDTLMCYSDALIEKEDKDGQMFDEHKLMRFSHMYHQNYAGEEMQKPQQLCHAVLECFYRETGDRIINDDLTLAIFNRI